MAAHVKPTHPVAAPESLAEEAGQALTEGTAPRKATAEEKEKAEAELRKLADERVRRATETAKLETRPKVQPGMKSANSQSEDYAVEEELRAMWPETEFSPVV